MTLEKFKNPASKRRFAKRNYQSFETIIQALEAKRLHCKSQFNYENNLRLYRVIDCEIRIPHTRYYCTHDMRMNETETRDARAWSLPHKASGKQTILIAKIVIETMFYLCE